MGIHGLSKLIADNAPDAIREHKMEAYFGRKIAIDASMSIYQFLIAVRSSGQMLANEAGDVTSHLQGIWSRTLRMLEDGLKPVYVFDGKPPTLKSGELAKRKKRHAEATDDLAQAEEEGNQENIEKYSKRTVRVNSEHNGECKRLLRLMGIPVIEAPCEAESQCAELARAGKVFATASEDMDSLTFATPILLRHLHSPEAKKVPIHEFNLSEVLAGLKMTMDQFIDVCILCGCDYVDPIKGVGPVTALKLIRDYGSIDNAMKHIQSNSKYTLPESFKYEEARELFLKPEVTKAEDIELVWGDCDEEGIRQYMIQEKGFDAKRIENGLEKLRKSKSKSTQGRLESFFGPVTVVKRKHDDISGGDKKGAKKAKVAPGKAAAGKGAAGKKAAAGKKK
mmetsp:Transcript_31642/g.51071  ORF Transcript_31642/g.51071 Transcript_31642/m.51071 type:complete len:394 (+) Transcript_31642:81-1262(+)